MIKRRIVIITEAARLDLFDIYSWILEEAGWNTAGRYVERLEKFCMNLDIASQRGSLQTDIRPGLRIVGFERRLTIAFAVHEERVEILRVFRAGKDWENDPFDE